MGSHSLLFLSLNVFSSFLDQLSHQFLKYMPILVHTERHSSTTVESPTRHQTKRDKTHDVRPTFRFQIVFEHVLKLRSHS